MYLQLCMCLTYVAYDSYIHLYMSFKECSYTQVATKARRMYLFLDYMHLPMIPITVHVMYMYCNNSVNCIATYVYS